MDKGNVGRKLFSYYTNLPVCKPDMINLGLTHRCDMGCKVCNTKEKNPDLKEEMSAEDLKKLIKDIGRWGDIGVSFAGGEPLIRKDILIDCIKTAKDEGLTTYMTTNGRQVDKETAEDIVDSDLDFISVSLDGINEETNNYIRDSGSHEGAVRAIENLKKSKIENGSDLKIGLTTVVNSKNLDDLIGLHDFVMEEDLYEINYHPYVPDNSFMNKVDYENDEFWIQEKDQEKLEKVVKKLIEIKKSEKGRIGTSDFILENIPDYFENKEKFSKGQCLAGQAYMYVKPNGNVDVCGKGPSFNLRPMNVKDRGIKEIWRSINFFITRLKIKVCDRPCLMLCFPKINARSFAKEVIS